MVSDSLLRGKMKEENRENDGQRQFIELIYGRISTRRRSECMSLTTDS